MEFAETQAISWDNEDEEASRDSSEHDSKIQVATLTLLPYKQLSQTLYPVYKGKNVIGRGPSCDIQILATSLSKEHASIEVVDESHLLSDLSTVNKTRRGKLILKPHVQYELKDGDVITFGDVICHYNVSEKCNSTVLNSDPEVSGLASDFILQSDSESSNNEDSTVVDETPMAETQKPTTLNTGVKNEVVQRLELGSDSDSDTDIEGADEKIASNQDQKKSQVTSSAIVKDDLEGGEVTPTLNENSSSGSHFSDAETVPLPWARQFVSDKEDDDESKKNQDKLVIAADDDATDDDIFNMETQLLPVPGNSDANNCADDIYTAETQPYPFVADPDESTFCDKDQTSDTSEIIVFDNVNKAAGDDKNSEDKCETLVITSNESKIPEKKSDNEMKEQIQPSTSSALIETSNETAEENHEKAVIDDKASVKGGPTVTNSVELNAAVGCTGRRGKLGRKKKENTELVATETATTSKVNNSTKDNSKSVPSPTAQKIEPAPIATGSKQKSPAKEKLKVVEVSTKSPKKAISARNKRKSTPRKLVLAEDEETDAVSKRPARRKIFTSSSESSLEEQPAAETAKRVTRSRVQQQNDSDVVKRPKRDIKKPAKFLDPEEASTSKQPLKCVIKTTRTVEMKKDEPESSKNEDVARRSKRVANQSPVSKPSTSRITEEIDPSPKRGSKRLTSRSVSVDSSQSSSASKSSVKASPSPAKRPCSRLSLIKTTPKITFTGMSNTKTLEKIVVSLGGEVTESVTDCTHLVTDKVRRTCKLLCILSRGCPIVVPEWLKASKTANEFMGEVDYLVKDEEAESKFDFTMELSLSRAAANIHFLANHSIHVTKSVQPPQDEMKSIIECAGGKYLSRMPSVKPKVGVSVIVSCPQDLELCKKSRSAGISIVSSEFILTGVLRQKAQINLYRI